MTNEQSEILNQFRKKREVLFSQKIKLQEDLRKIEKELEENEDEELNWKSESGYFKN